MSRGTASSGDGIVLLGAMTGFRCSGRTAIAALVEEKFESLLSERHPGWTFVFLESPVAHLPLPILDKQHVSQRARAKILHLWGDLYEFIIEDYLPLVERAKQGEKIIAFSDGFGLDVLKHATACTACKEGQSKATKLHHMIVHHLLVEEGVPKPIYYRLTAKPTSIKKWMRHKCPKLRNVTDEKLLGYIQHQEETDKKYFLPETGQHQFPLDAENYSHEELAQQVFDHMCAEIEKKQARKVA